MRNNAKPIVAFVSLGCAKALVDTEQMMAQLAQKGFTISFDTESADLVVVNTCSFIEPARRESFEVIREFEEKRRDGRIAGLFVVGCLPQLLGQELSAQFEDVDAFVPLDEMSRLAEIIDGSVTESDELVCGHPAHDPAPRLLATPPHTAYLKIAEGCDNCCSYCLIPRIRGPLVSRHAKPVLVEARQLAAMGVKELNLVAQDVAAWGRDLSPRIGRIRSRLDGLLDDLCAVDGIEWIRLLYAHPASIDSRLLEAVARNEKVCNYLDIPVQHSEDRILAAMNRRITGQALADLISRIRAAVPGIVLRTTVIVGFPGETEAEFQRIMAFLEEARFDRLGAFAYCREAGTPAASLKRQVPNRVKQERLDAVMQLQARISHEKNAALVGRELDAIIDQAMPGKRGRAPLLIGRTRGQAPDVDGVVRIKGDASAGDIVRAIVTSADEYDLEAELVRG
ncbi:MAG: 30S ribosomal protein S12 methylthiotransferase RimO [Candidatus Coatesbacteria bacterium]|nr:30S ribosomal protein S12 methylthiotransferase RimO [Candidatus Coatesbacteria bacterium]